MRVTAFVVSLLLATDGGRRRRGGGVRRARCAAANMAAGRPRRVAPRLATSGGSGMGGWLAAAGTIETSPSLPLAPAAPHHVPATEGDGHP